MQFDCHPEQAVFAPRGIWASRALRRALCDTTIARLARFLTKLHRYPSFLSVIEGIRCHAFPAFLVSW